MFVRRLVSWKMISFLGLYMMWIMQLESAQSKLKGPWMQLKLKLSKMVLLVRARKPCRKKMAEQLCDAVVTEVV
jgi:hypothetical protein